MVFYSLSNGRKLFHNLCLATSRGIRERLQPNRQAATRFPALANASRSSICHDRRIDFNQLCYPRETRGKKGHTLQSAICTRALLDSNAFGFWANELKERKVYHRKLWEFCFILQALYERGALRENQRGLGFAVGQEPLPALMAKMGCQIVATDLEANDSRAEPWAQTNQLANSIWQLNSRGICSNRAFAERVKYRPVDMNSIPNDLVDFDFTWSSCSFEHCGSIELGLRFILEQMKCLAPGGIAVHTTEFNLSSNTETVERGSTVIFRLVDIEKLVVNLHQLGHFVEPFCFASGNSKEDQFVDTFPYSQNPHLKLNLFNLYDSTSIGLIIKKGPR